MKRLIINIEHEEVFKDMIKHFKSEPFSEDMTLVSETDDEFVLKITKTLSELNDD